MASYDCKHFTVNTNLYGHTHAPIIQTFNNMLRLLRIMYDFHCNVWFPLHHFLYTFSEPRSKKKTCERVWCLVFDVCVCKRKPIWCCCASFWWCAHTSSGFQRNVLSCPRLPACVHVGFIFRRVQFCLDSLAKHEVKNNVLVLDRATLFWMEIGGAERDGGASDECLLYAHVCDYPNGWWWHLFF